MKFQLMLKNLMPEITVKRPLMITPAWNNSIFPRLFDGRNTSVLVVVIMCSAALSVSAQTNSSILTNSAGLVSKEGTSITVAAPKTAEKTLSIEERTEKIRAACITGRRYVCGKVVQIAPEGLVVDSGYSVLLTPPYNQSWVVPGNATVARDPHPVELNTADAVCVGLVYIMDIPKKPAVKENDYVVLHAYP